MRIATLLLAVTTVSLGVAVGCGDDASNPATGSGGETGSGGGDAAAGMPSNQSGSSSTAGSNNGGSDAGGGANESGAPSSGGAGGSVDALGGSDAGGADAGGADGGGGDPDPISTQCAAFPKTVTLGPTIQLNTFGAVLCYSPDPPVCRLTTNTYSDGDGYCPNGQSVLVFMQGNSNTVNMPQGWEFKSASAGTFSQNSPSYLSAVPTSTEVTAVITSPAAADYTVVFTFHGSQSFTITSFTKN